MQQTITRISRALTGRSRSQDEAMQQEEAQQQKAQSKPTYPQEPGIFVAYTQPNSSLSVEEFDDWYNNEHGPARMRLSWIHNGLRYKVDDGSKPEYLALYDVDDMSLFETEDYTSLLKNASEREQGIVKEGLETLDRRFHTQISSHGCVKKAPAKVVMMVHVLVNNEADFDAISEWYEEEHIGLLAKIPGWQRSRRFRMFAPERDDGKIAMLLIHEWDSQKNFCGGGHHAARETPWKKKIKEEISAEWEKRIFTLYHELDGGSKSG